MFIIAQNGKQVLNVDHLRELYCDDKAVNVTWAYKPNGYMADSVTIGVYHSADRAEDVFKLLKSIIMSSPMPQSYKMPKE